jgi:hypothetical protein
LLEKLLRRHNALVLALDAAPGYAYVNTAANPADAPSGHGAGMNRRGELHR